MVRWCHLHIPVLGLDVGITQVRHHMHHEAGKTRAFSRMPCERDAHESFKVRSTFVLEGLLVFLAVLGPRAALHFTVSEARHPVVIDKYAIEDTQFWKASLPSALHHADVRLVHCPNVQTLQHGFCALNDGVCSGTHLLDARCTVATTESHLEHIARLINTKLLNAFLHVRSLPLHHNLCPVSVQQLLLAVSVQGEEETICPLAKL
mmetsp:Transcript_59969/g.118960  ORF Transcript_59969/g.118960 Transcript_59969/m.118960 type:complete len:206 (+) Transcript_59969:351-968(+)